MRRRVLLHVLQRCFPACRPNFPAPKLPPGRHVDRGGLRSTRNDACQYTSSVSSTAASSLKRLGFRRPSLSALTTPGERTVLQTFSLFRHAWQRLVPCAQFSSTAARGSKNTALVRVWNQQDEVAVIPEYGIPILPKTRFTPLGIVLCFVPIFTFGLGVWQLYRLGWKIRLIEELENKLEMPIVRLPKIISDRTFENLQFRRVYVTGKFLHEKELHFGPRPKDDLGAGYYIITPLQREDGQTIMVNRGWVANWRKEMKDRPISVKKMGAKGDTVRIVGILRRGQLGNPLTPLSNPARNEWYKLDLHKMAEYCGAEPILVEQLTETEPTRSNTLYQKDKGVPLASVATVDLRNTHLQYAITWFGLSFCTTIAAFVALKTPRRFKLYG